MTIRGLSTGVSPFKHMIHISACDYGVASSTKGFKCLLENLVSQEKQRESGNCNIRQEASSKAVSSVSDVKKL
jgi:hypothetical protein